MVLTRRRGFSILGNRKSHYYGSFLDKPGPAISTDDLLWYDTQNDNDPQSLLGVSKHRSKQRICCGLTIVSPNSSRFSHYLHSRILQKFPFLVEMFYWITTYLFYRLTKVISQEIFSKTGIWDVAQDHGLAVLEFEQIGWLTILFPVTEHDFQQWFMHGHQTALTVLNRAYALIHIPGTVWLLPDPSGTQAQMMLTRAIVSLRGTTTSPLLIARLQQSGGH